MPSILLTLTLLCGRGWADDAEISAPTAPPPASEPAPPDPLPLLLHLHAAGDHQGLRSEALRAGFDAELSPRLAAEVQYMGALASLGLGERDRAIGELGALSQQLAAPEIAGMSQLVLAATWLEWSPAETARRAQAWLEAHPEGPLVDDAARLAALGHASAGRPAMALSVLDTHAIPVSPALRAELAEPMRWKRPALAAALSGALPGSGQLYAGHPREALSAFAVNALFIGGAVAAARQEAWPTLGVLGFFGLGFYFGNIYGAADASLRTNRERRDLVVDHIEDELGPLGAPPLPTAGEAR